MLFSQYFGAVISKIALNFLMNAVTADYLNLLVNKKNYSNYNNSLILRMKEIKINQNKWLKILKKNDHIL